MKKLVLIVGLSLCGTSVFAAEKCYRLTSNNESDVMCLNDKGTEAVISIKTSIHAKPFVTYTLVPSGKEMLEGYLIRHYLPQSQKSGTPFQWYNNVSVALKTTKGIERGYFTFQWGGHSIESL